MTQYVHIPIALPSQLETKKIIRRLGEIGAWHYVRFILWCAQRPCTAPGPLRDAVIERAVEWDGEAGAFAAALREAGVLVATSEVSSAQQPEAQ